MRRGSVVSSRSGLLVMNANGFALVGSAESVGVTVTTAVVEFPAGTRADVVEVLGEATAAWARIHWQVASV